MNTSSLVNFRKRLKRSLLTLAALGLTFGAVSSSYGQQNIAPQATVTGSDCRLGPCSTLNDLNYGTCGTQQMWIYTNNNTPSSTPGVQWIQWEFPHTVVVDSLVIYNGQSTARILTGFLVQYWDGSQWVDGNTVSNLPSACKNGTGIGLITAKKFRITAFQMTGVGQTYNPNFREIEVYNMPFDVNAGVSALVGGDFCSGVQPIKVRVTNLGQNDLTSVDVDWEIDGTPQTGQSLTFSPGLSVGQDTVITLGSYDFGYQTPVDFKAWTSQPNNTQDENAADDTLSTTITAAKQGITAHISPENPKICSSGGGVVLDAGNSGHSFLWSDGTVTQTDAVTSPGTYWVVVTSGAGCSAADTVEVGTLDAATAADISANQTSGPGIYSFSADGAQDVTGYHWDFGDGMMSTDANPTHTYTKDSTYTVTLEVSNKCGSKTLTKELEISGLGISQLNLNKDQLLLYPNPAKDWVVIKNESDFEMASVRVYNLLGQKVFEGKISTPKKFRIDTKAFSNGIYQVKINFKNGSWINRKLSIKK